MAHKKLQATAELFLNTKNAKKDAQIFIDDLKQKLIDIESAADKMTVFKDMVAYIAQVDRAMADLKKNNKDAFNSMFGGLDASLKKQLEGLFGVDGDQLNQIDVLREKLQTLTPKSSIKELRNFADEINKIFTSLGVSTPFNNIAEQFSGKVNAGHIELLTDALANLSVVWQDVNMRVAKGFGLGGPGGGLVSPKVQAEIDKLQAKMKTYKQTLDILSGDYDIKIDTTIDNDVQELQKLIDAYKEAEKVKNQFSQNPYSAEYRQAYAEQVRLAVLLKNTMDHVGDYGSDDGAELVAKNIGIYSSIENFLENDFYSMSSKQLNQIQELVSQMLDSIKADVESLQAVGSNGLGIDEKAVENASKKLQEFLQLRDKIVELDEAFSLGTDVDIGKYMERLDAAKMELEELGKQGLLTADQLEEVAKVYDNAQLYLRSNVRNYTGYGNGNGAASYYEVISAENAAEEAQKRAEEAELRVQKAEAKVEELESDLRAGDLAAQRILDEKFELEAENEKLKEQINKQSAIEGSTQKLQEQTSELNQIEAKTQDVTNSFKELVNYISQSSYSPGVFFDKLESGAQQVDDELKNILQSLNLIDSKGNINLKSIKSGFTNNGGFVSDNYTMIARSNEYLPKIESLQLMLQNAKEAGAQIGAIFGVIEDKAKGLIYEIQNTVAGQAVYSFHDGAINKDILNATDNQIQDLINTLQILQKNGIFVDWGGDNVLYDKEKGFSIIDLGNQGDKGYTVSSNNTIQENLDRLVNNIFALDPDMQQQVQSMFADRLYKIAADMVPSELIAQKNVIANTKSEEKQSIATDKNISKETVSHEKNAEAIQEENAALQAQIELKKKAQSMKWEEFALDDSSNDLKQAAGIQTLSDMEKFWKGANYEKQIDWHELSEEQAKKIIDLYVPKSLRDDWYFANDFSAKSKIENIALSNDEVRNAGLNLLHQYFKKYSGSTIGFNDFLNTEFTAYRGDEAPIIYGDTEKLSYSLIKSQAQKFLDDALTDIEKDDKTGTAKVYPKDTIGNIGSGMEKEVELWLPSAKSSWFKEQERSFAGWYHGLTKEMQDEIDVGLINAEKNRVAGILGDDIVNAALDGNLDSMSNDISESQKKLVDYFLHLNSLAKSLPEQFTVSGGFWEESKHAVGKDAVLFNTVMNDPDGVQQHVEQLTNQSQFGLFEQTIQKETDAHKQNTQAIKEEAQAQQKLNSIKASQITQEEAVDRLEQLWMSENLEVSDAVSELIPIMDSIKSTPQNVLDKGVYQDYYTGEEQNVEDLYNLINNIEQQHGENLGFLKDYLNQVFAKHNAETKNLDTTNVDSSDDVIVGHDKDDIANASQELKLEQEITEEKQKQVSLDNSIAENNDTQNIKLDAESAENNIAAEAEQLDKLTAVLGGVKTAVDAKTKAFIDEGNVVGQSVGKEISALKKLSETVDEISPKVDSLASGFKNINKQKASSAKSGTVAANNDATQAAAQVQDAQTTDQFTKSLYNQKQAFNEYRTSLENVSYASPELRAELDKLAVSLQQIEDASGLKDFKNAFDGIKDKISAAKGAFEKVNFGNINSAENNLINTFNNLTFDQKSSVEQEYKNAIAMLEKYRVEIQNGKEVELSAINEVVSALRQKLEAYKQANKEAKNVAAAQKKNANFGSTASINATAKYNSLSKMAASDQFASSPIVSDAMSKYEQSYKNMIAMRDRLRNSDVIDDSDKETFKSLTTECNNYAKTLEKLIQSSLKLKSSKANLDDYMLGADFVDDKEGRIAALTDFAKKFYDVNLIATDFKDNWNKAVFAVDNGDGTFTQMTATFTDARNEIVAMAGETKKSVGLMGQLWDQYKGKLKSVFSYFLATISIYDVWNVVKQGVQHIREINSALTELKKVTDETDASYNQFLQDMSKTGAVIGATVKDLTLMAAEWARLGYSMEDAGKLAESTAILLNVSEFDDATAASEALISTMQAFKYTADESGHVVDILNEVGNNFAVSSDGLATALQDSASALMEGGNNLEQAVALVAAANRVVNFVPRLCSNIEASR